ELVAGSAVVERDLSVLRKASLFELFLDLLARSARERRHDRLVVKSVRSKSEMELEYLPEVHSRRHSERSEDDVDRGSVSHVRHVFLRKDLRDDSLVSVAPCELVADRYGSKLSDLDMDPLYDA